MYLKYLELQGFKSFPDRIKLEFDKGITAVVGPNGSGKSNIGDAMRWVLGEQSSKTLRGAKMEDVIFAGTEERKPMGYASVTLCIANDGGELPLDTGEVTVTRKLYRSGESEYIINGEQKRLRDVSELFMDTGLGRDGYSIIGQGRIAEIVSSRSGERRAIFEEAAGISKFRYRKADAQNQLAKAEDNILRITDMLSELESRVEPLRIQSEKAPKFLVLADEKKVLDITFWMMDHSELSAKISELGDKLLINKTEYTAAENRVNELESRSEDISKDINLGNIAIERLQGELVDNERSNSEAKAQAAVCENEIKHSLEKISELEKSISDVEDSTEKNRRLTEEHIEHIKALEAEKDRLRAELREAQAKLTSAESDSAGAEKKQSENDSRLNELYIKRTEYSSLIRMAEDSAAQAEKEAQDASERLAQSRQDESALDKEYKEVTEAKEVLTEHIAEQNNRIAGMSRLLDTKKAKTDKLQSSVSETEMQINTLSTRLRMLQDLENSLEGYNGAVRALLKAARGGRISGIRGTVSQIISVPPEYSVAIETALGGALQNLVTDNEEAAKKGIRLLKDMNAGRATFLPVTSVKGNRLHENGLAQCAGFIALACELVEYDDIYRGIADQLLGRIVIAEDLDSAGAIAKRFGYRFRIVTLDGQVVNAGGSYTGGSANRTAGILTRKNDIEQITSELNELGNKRDRFRTELAAAKAEYDKMRFDSEALHNSLSTAQTDMVRFEGELKRIEQLKSQIGDAASIADRAVENASRKRRETADIIEKNRRLLDELAAQIAELEAESGQNQEEHERLMEMRSQLSAHMTDIQVRTAGIDKDVEAAQSAIEQLRIQSKSIGDSSVEYTLRIDEEKKAIEVKKQEIARINASLQSSEGYAEKTRSEISSLRMKNLEFEKKRGEVAAAIKEAGALREELSAERTRLEERIDTASQRREQIMAEMREQYEIYPSEAAEIMMKDADKYEVEKNLNSVRNKIRNLGTVNLSAIEEYKEVSERYTFRKRELDDINRSKHDLEKLIDELTETMKRQFSDTFARINEEFKRIFTELFGGGRAELILSDPSNVLETGIEINVAPPGKVIKSLSLLSGGEQAFVAIAIYFAILKIRPAPFCILDEIEAALDDINVVRYASYLHKYVHSTQFIAITHRRGTMEEADVMYGVTMQEKGISRLLKLDQMPEQEQE